MPAGTCAYAIEAAESASRMAKEVSLPGVLIFSVIARDIIILGIMIHSALSVAGSDPSGGAGIQADLKTFASLSVYGMGVIAALTAQNTQGVRDVMHIPADFVGLQLDAVL